MKGGLPRGRNMLFVDRRAMFESEFQLPRFTFVHFHSLLVISSLTSYVQSEVEVNDQNSILEKKRYFPIWLQIKQNITLSLSLYSQLESHTTRRGAFPVESKECRTELMLLEYQL